MLGNPVHYRDSRTEGVMERVFERVLKSEIFNTTGIQFSQINSLYQLMSLVESDSPQLHTADGFWLRTQGWARVIYNLIDGLTNDIKETICLPLSFKLSY